MKGFFSWFKSGNKIKRWLFLIILSMIAVCYSISVVMVTNELDVKTIVKIVFCFVLGFVGMVIGCVSMQKRNLEILIKKTDKSPNVKSLIYNKKVYDQGPKIVVIGGGRGLNTVLKGLKEYTENITAVVNVSDGEDDNSDQGNTGMPLKDIKDSMVALSRDEEEMSKLLNLKLQYGGGKPLTFGDVFLLGMKNLHTDFSKSVEKSGDILNMTGKVLPVTQDKIEICAELSDGTIVNGKNKIPETVVGNMETINRIFINPSNTKVTSSVVKAIREADAIIIGPGSLYTEVIPNLLIKGVSRAIKESEGFKIYISNIMTEPGQTSNYKLSDHIEAIKRHIGEASIDYCIYDSGEIMPEYIRKYNLKGSEVLEQDIQRAKAEGVKIIKRDLATVEDNRIVHDSKALANAIIELICEDLKFRDRQNDPQYMLLSHKLKSKKIKSTQMERWTRPKLDKSGKSKFYAKYYDRIDSLKQSNKKIKSDIDRCERNSKMLERVNSMRSTRSNLENLKKRK